MGRLGLGVGTGCAARRRSQGGGAHTTDTAGALPSAFAITPSVHYHFTSQTVSVDGSNRLVSCPDMQGLASLFAAAGTTPPTLMTDALGREFLRFNGSEAAVIANTLVVASNRSFMALMVGRMHHAIQTQQLLNARFATYADPANNTITNTSVGYLRGRVVANGAPFLSAGAPFATTNTADCHKVIPGCQMQVMAVASRTAADGGTRLYINNHTCDVAQQTTAVANYIGGVVCGTGASNNSEALANTSNTFLDLYELAFWNTGPLNAMSDAAVAAAVSNYSIPQLDTNLLLEGDSLTYSSATSLPESPANSKGLGSRLTEPGAELVPGNVRVLNRGSSGATVATLTTRRDDAASVHTLGRYPGGPTNNITAIQIGRNDLNATATTAAVHYANVVAYLNTASSGVLQQGWRVVQAGNIASSTKSIAGPDAPITLQERIEAFRAMIFSGTAINPNFANDTQSGAGQPHEGLVSVLPVHRITVAGDTAFSTNADALDTAAGFYSNDQTDLRVAGVDLMASGGDNPAWGYQGIL